MQWYTLSLGERAGPYDPDELREMFQSNEITLDTFIVAEGSDLARKVYCAPEIFFDDIITLRPNARAPQRLQSARSATRIAPLAPPKGQPSPHFEKQEMPASPGFKTEPAYRKRKKNSRAQKENHGAETPKGQPPNPPPTPKAKNLKQKVNHVPSPPDSGTRLNQINNRGLTGEEAKESVPPAHQLPKAVSEAQIKQRDDFGWAKNRVNPTAPRSIYHIAEKRPRSRHRERRSALPHEVKLLLLGFAAILVFLIITNMIVNKPSPQRQPRFSEQKASETDRIKQSHPNDVTFDNAKPIVVSPQKNAPTKRKNVQSKQQEPRNNPKSTKKTRKEPEPPKRIAAQPQTQQKKQQQQQKPEGRLQARAPIQAGIPRSWPKTRINGSEDLAKNLFKQVSIERVRLLLAPQQCSPCQIPAVLRDGTRILLTSQSITPWENISKTGSLNVKANGLLTRTAQGTYSLIVKEVAP